MRLALLLIAPLIFADGGRIAWYDGAQHEKAFAEAKMFGKPIVIYFTSDN